LRPRFWRFTFIKWNCSSPVRLGSLRNANTKFSSSSLNGSCYILFSLVSLSESFNLIASSPNRPGTYSSPISSPWFHPLFSLSCHSPLRNGSFGRVTLLTMSVLPLVRCSISIPLSIQIPDIPHLDEYENYATPVSSATTFLFSLASNRTKTTFMPILGFINTVLRSYVTSTVAYRSQFLLN